MRPDVDGFKIQDESLLADPSVIAHGQLPGKMNVHAGFDDHAAAHLGAEKAEDGPFAGRWNWQRGEEEAAFDQIPQSFHEFGPATIQSHTGIEQIEAEPGFIICSGVHRLRKGFE